MAEKINVTLNVQVVGGPRISSSLNGEVEAYDKIDFTVGAGETDIGVDVQPSAAAQIKLLMIGLSDPKQYGTEVTYKINDTTATATTVKLDAPQLFMGKGAVGLLGLTDPTRLFFSNSLTEDISVQILVGRDATPTP